ncbi:mitochondrial tRNA-specific 2-thiouridylase 1-like [Pyrus ussuriensis x Pyrus communis]|uniref:Mitochondrial tRNA-specific 2-thiouridylase 1-like n=1 Tax=Pyrus ussuriensis x Pyrus communis TaxID=2448454 RepID=A0A5N5HU34_9ROSA|nr:mitochondrial tRNA-specific 2-thiouridylase 1-like [Pyrus ussuriensis x Pyrus communis]
MKVNYIEWKLGPFGGPTAGVKDLSLQYVMDLPQSSSPFSLTFAQTFPLPLERKADCFADCRVCPRCNCAVDLKGDNQIFSKRKGTIGFLFLFFFYNWWSFQDLLPHYSCLSSDSPRERKERAREG